MQSSVHQGVNKTNSVCPIPAPKKLELKAQNSAPILSKKSGSMEDLLQKGEDEKPLQRK